jgi:hypothetical protein
VSQTRQRPNRIRGPRRLLATSAGILAILAVGAASAFGAYEKDANFGGAVTAPVPPAVFPEDAQLGGAMGLAVNVQGAGGVPAGSVYAADSIGNGVQISRFSSEGGFELAWGNGPRCGPALGTSCPTQAEGTEKAAVDVDIDQTTGNVYVFDHEGQAPGTDAITEYSADGSQVISQFAEIAGGSEGVLATPAKIHGSFGLPGDIAVNSSGTVYVYDTEQAGEFRSRLMVFEPEVPGVYTQYRYAGEATGAPHGLGLEHDAGRPVIDDAGNVFTAGEGSVEEFDPTAPSPTPICSFAIKNNSARGMTVDPASGTVFFFDYKKRLIHELSGTCGSDGHFVEVEAFPLTPVRGYPQALTFNPALAWENGPTPGLLYVAAPGAIGEAGGGEKGAGGIGYVYSNHITAAPAVELAPASGVAPNSAVFRGKVLPNGLSTSYVFQYETLAAFEANDPSEAFSGSAESPLGGAVLAQLQGSIGVSATVAGLSPNTPYVFRLVATNEKGVAPSGTEGFSTFPEVLGPADGRAYELVSPSEKDGGEVYPALPERGSCVGVCKPGAGLETYPEQSSPDGASVAYEGSSFLSGLGGLQENQYVSRRTASGWQTTMLTPAQQSVGVGAGFRGFDPQLSVGIMGQVLPTLSGAAPAEYPNLYRVAVAAPTTFEPLLGGPPADRQSGVSLQLRYAGASEDFTRFFFTANDALTEGTPFAPPAEDGGQAKTNLYEWSDGQLKLVNVLPGNATAPAGASFGNAAGDLTRSISESGARIFWSSESGQVYVRENGEETTEVSTGGTPDPGRFVAASADGSKVLLANGHLHDLEGSEETIDLSQGQGGFLGALGTSDDLSEVYFVDTAALTGDQENEAAQKAEVGADNLYSWQGGNTTFIGQLLSGETADWAPTSISMKPAQASANGRWLAFQSAAQMTTLGTTGPCGSSSGKAVSAPCSQAYLFDAAEDLLRCVSCSPTGEAPTGNSTIPIRPGVNAPALPQMAYLTSDGRLFFDSQNRLSVKDTNGIAEDVYESEPAGVGSCDLGGGCINLISSGRSATDSNFLAASATGDDAFFTTRAQLVPADKDGLVDLYDARVGGGFEAESSATECTGETCQQSPPVSTATSPGSTAVSPESPAPAVKCKKGQVRKDGKCVEKKQKHKKHKKKNRNKRHAAHKAKPTKTNDRGGK